MTTSPQLTQHLAAWITKQQELAIPAEVKHQVERMMLDHLSGVIAASPESTGKIVARHAQRYFAPGDATVFGAGSLSALGAAMVNGTLAHGIETDDGYTPGSYHPSCVVFPAVFAAAEELNSTPVRILTAIAIGAEVGCRIAAAGHPATRHRGFHNTAIVGVFSSAAATAVLLGLDEYQTANALGIAGSHASGLFEFLDQSSEVKRFHAGKAARDGISSAYLAAEGLTGPTTVFEGRDGYFAAYAGERDTAWNSEFLLEGLGEDWVMLNTYVKPYPCCRHLHGAIDAFLHLVDNHGINAHEIASIEVETFAIAAGHDNTEVETIMGAQLSLPFTLAIAAVNQRVRYEDFAEANYHDEFIQELMERVRIQTGDQAQADYPLNGRPATVKVSLKNGDRFQHHVQFPYGEPQNPISDQDLQRKAIDAVEPHIGNEGAHHLIDAIWDFDGLEFLQKLNHLLESSSTRPQRTPAQRTFDN